MLERLPQTPLLHLQGPLCQDRRSTAGRSFEYDAHSYHHRKVGMGHISLLP